MMVTDLQHFLDRPLDEPGSARGLAKQLGDLVSAANAGDATHDPVSWQAM